MIHLYSHKGLLQATYSNWNVSVMQFAFSLLLGKKSVSLCRAVARTLIGGGGGEGVYSYIQVLPD